jgi:hypothetical protein
LQNSRMTMQDKKTPTIIIEHYKNKNLEDISGEVWKPILDFDGYEVSNFGRVKSLDRILTHPLNGTYLRKGVIISQIIQRGYLLVSIGRKTKKRHTFLVHRLVAFAFISNPDNKRTINHINPIKTLNTVENLEWATDKENKHHAMELGLSVVCKAGIGRDHYKAKPVIQMALDGLFVKKWDCIADTKKYGYHPSHIGECCNGQANTHGGFKWKYA